MVSSHKQSAERTPQWKEQSFSTDPYLTSLYYDPSTVFSTSDWTEYLEISKAAKFEVIRSDFYGGGGGGAVCGGGGGGAGGGGAPPPRGDPPPAPPYKCLYN